MVGRAVSVESGAEIQDVSLSQRFGLNKTLEVDVTALHRTAIASNYTFELLVDGTLEDSETVLFQELNQTKKVTLEWLLKAGVYTITIKSGDAEVERLVKITGQDGGFEVVELTSEADEPWQTHVLDFTKGTEFDIAVQNEDIIKATFEAQTYLFTVENISSTLSIAFRNTTINIAFENQTKLDLNEDGVEDLIIIFSAVQIADPTIASLTLKTVSERTTLDFLASFWWLVLIVIIILITLFVMRKYELQRTKHGRILLKRIKKYHASGVLKDSLYKKARRTLEKKLKP